MIYASSSEMEEHTANNSYLYLTHDDDDDYVMEGDSHENDMYSYSTETPDDDQIRLAEKPFDDLTDSFAKTPQVSREKTPEKAPGKNPVVPDDMNLYFSHINFRWVVSRIGWLLLNLLKVSLILGLCFQMARMINKNYDKQPVVPKFTLESVSVFPIQVDHVSSSTTGCNITAGWNMIFNVKNPSENHVLSYNDVAAEVYFGKNPLHHTWPLLPVLDKITPPSMIAKSIWKTAVPGFTQGEAHQDLLKVTFASFPVSIDNATATSLVKDINSGASRGFSIRLNGNITQSNPENELNRETGSFIAQCRLNMAFLQSGGVMATSSKECKIVTSGLDSWMVLVISVAAVHATLRAGFFLSGKFLDKRAQI